MAAVSPAGPDPMIATLRWRVSVLSVWAVGLGGMVAVMPSAYRTARASPASSSSASSSSPSCSRRSSSWSRRVASSTGFMSGVRPGGSSGLISRGMRNRSDISSSFRQRLGIAIGRAQRSADSKPMAPAALSTTWVIGSSPDHLRQVPRRTRGPAYDWQVRQAMADGHERSRTELVLQTPIQDQGRRRVVANGIQAGGRRGEHVANAGPGCAHSSAARSASRASSSRMTTSGAAPSVTGAVSSTGSLRITPTLHATGVPDRGRSG